MISALFLWWVILLALGWLAWPLTALLFPRSPGKGYAYARVIGLLALAYAFWLPGVLGLLPNTTARQVMDGLTDAIRREGGPDIADNMDIRFTYRHDASVCPADHPFVAALAEAVRGAGAEASVDAMTASCDAWLYNNQLNIPTVVFGGGSLSVAHSNTEHMPIAELAAAAETLAALAVRWCGAEERC